MNPLTQIELATQAKFQDSSTDQVLTAYSEMTTQDLSEYEPPPKAKPLFTPPGIPRAVFLRALDVSVFLHASLGSLNEDYLDPRRLKQHMPNVQISMLTKLVTTKSFHDGLILRGVINKVTTNGLSGDQIRALGILTDMTSFGSFEAKLKKAGIPSYRFNSWMNDSTFNALHDRLVHKAFLSAQGQIDAQIARGALDGKLDFIKYYNEVTERHTPNRRGHADVQTLLDGIADILMTHIRNPEQLKAISADLSVIVAKLG